MIQDRIVELRRVPASELLANPKNWRKHPKAQRDAMSSLLKEIGYADALLARETEEGLMLIDGHLRKETTPDQEVPVLIVDLEDNEADMLLAAHDPIAAMAQTDRDALETILLNTETDDEGVKKFFDRLANNNSICLGEGAVDDGELPTPEEAVVKPGDLWALGEHRLFCGDATNSVAVNKLLGDTVPFLMVTDPPYGVNYDPMWRDKLLAHCDNRSEGPVTNDDRADWTEAWRLFPGTVAYVWHGGLHTGPVHASLDSCGFQVRAAIQWVKHCAPVSRGAYHWKHEPCLYLVRKGEKAEWCGGRRQNTVWEIQGMSPIGQTTDELKRIRDDDGADVNNLHGTQKPVECMARPMRNHKCEAVYDPFLGSGTSVIAAEQTGKACYGLELEPGYCDVIIERWQNFTGQKAVKK